MNLKTSALCSVEGCDRPIRSLLMCATHYQRASRRYGRLHPPVCAIKGCARPAHCRGLCNSHYNAALRRSNLERYRGYDHRWREANPQTSQTKNREYAERHPDVVKTVQSRRRAHEVAATGSFTAADWAALVARAKRCHWCKRPWTKRRRPTHDHVIPLSRGGENSVQKSVCACMPCNRRKQATRFAPNNGQGILL